jgi:hypothetical protein
MAPDLSAAERAVLADFAAAVRAAFGRRVARIVLFGSRARGEGNEESDLDVLVLLRDTERKDQLRIYDIAYDLWTTTGIDISPFVRTPEALATLRARERRIALEIERDGVPL